MENHISAYTVHIFGTCSSNCDPSPVAFGKALSLTRDYLPHPAISGLSHGQIPFFLISLLCVIVGWTSHERYHGGALVMTARQEGLWSWVMCISECCMLEGEMEATAITVICPDRSTIRTPRKAQPVGHS